MKFSTIKLILTIKIKGKSKNDTEDNEITIGKLLKKLSALK